MRAVLLLALTWLCMCDVWIPKLRPVLWGDYRVGVRNLSIATPSLNASRSHIQYLGHPITSDIVSVRAIPPRKTCTMAAYVYRHRVSKCHAQVRVGEHYMPIEGILVESSTIPGIFHVCPADWVFALNSFSNYLDLVPSMGNYTVHNRTYTCTTDAFHLHNPLSLISQGCVLSVLCKNFGVELELADGNRVTVDDVVATGEKLLTEYVLTQGPEIRDDLSECLTQRCLVAPNRKTKRVRRDNWVSGGTHCGGALVYMYCPQAATTDSVNSAFREVHKRIESISVGIADQVDKLTQIESKFRDTTATMITKLEERINEGSTRLNEAFESIAKGHENMKVVQKIYREQESFLRNLMDQVMQQRVYARDMMAEFNWYSRLAMSAVSSSELDTMRILAERDLEVSNLLTAGYEFVVSSAMTQSGITIFYSMPYNYELHMVYLPYKPSLRLEESCIGDNCERCVTQIAESTKLLRPTKGTIDQRAAVQVTPFEVSSCLRTGAPSYMVVALPGECLNITIFSTKTVPCNNLASRTTMPVRLPPTLAVDVFYLPEPDLQLPYFDIITGSKEYAQLVTDLNQRSSEEVDTLKRITTTHGYKTYHDAAESGKVAKDALILGSVSMSLIIVHILAKVIKYTVRASRARPQIGYNQVGDTNRTIAKPQEHTKYSYNLKVIDKTTGQMYVRHLTVHTTQPSPLRHEEQGLICRVGDGSFLVQADIVGTKINQCYCPENEVAYYSAYPF
nr:TPA_asm: putative glycoprotein [Taeniapi tapwovirus]